MRQQAYQAQNGLLLTAITGEGQGDGIPKGKLSLVPNLPELPSNSPKVEFPMINHTIDTINAKQLLQAYGLGFWTIVGYAIVTIGLILI